MKQRILPAVLIAAAVLVGGCTLKDRTAVEAECSFKPTGQQSVSTNIAKIEFFSSSTAGLLDFGGGGTATFTVNKINNTNWSGRCPVSPSKIRAVEDSLKDFREGSANSCIIPDLYFNYSFDVTYENGSKVSLYTTSRCVQRLPWYAVVNGNHYLYLGESLQNALLDVRLVNNAVEP